MADEREPARLKQQARPPIKDQVLTPDEIKLGEVYRMTVPRLFRETYVPLKSARVNYQGLLVQQCLILTQEDRRTSPISLDDVSLADLGVLSYPDGTWNQSGLYSCGLERVKGETSLKDLWAYTPPAEIVHTSSQDVQSLRPMLELLHFQRRCVVELGGPKGVKLDVEEKANLALLAVGRELNAPNKLIASMRALERLGATHGNNGMGNFYEESASMLDQELSKYYRIMARPRSVPQLSLF